MGDSSLMDPFNRLPGVFNQFWRHCQGKEILVDQSNRPLFKPADGVCRPVSLVDQPVHAK